MPKLNFLLILIFSGLLWPNQTLHAEDNDRFNEGIKKYQQKDYAGAEIIWSKIIQKNPMDAPALLNQALTYSQQKKWGLALAYLREAQMLEPRNSKIQQAYEFAITNAKSRGFQEEDTFLNSFEFHVGKYFLLPEILSFHWFLSLVLLIVLGQLFRQRRRSKYTGAPVPKWGNLHWSFTSTWVLLSLVLLLKIASTTEQKATVIKSGSTTIRSAPVADAAELAEIPEGALISIRDFYQDWVQVRFDKVPVGWLQRKDLLLLTPEGFR